MAKFAEWNDENNRRRAEQGLPPMPNWGASASSEPEQSRTHTNKVEIRRLPTGTTSTLSGTAIGSVRGYAVVWDSKSLNLGGFWEKVRPGAFSRCLAGNPDIRCLINHDPNQILGRTRNSTLKLRMDDTGLYAECAIPDTSYGRDLIAQSEAGINSNNWSFGFVSVADHMEPGRIRIVEQADINEVTVVTGGVAAYQETSAIVEARVLAECGLSRAGSVLTGVSHDPRGEAVRAKAVASAPRRAKASEPVADIADWDTLADRSSW